MKSRDPEKLDFIIKSIENKGKKCGRGKSWDLEFHKETNHIYIRWYSQSCPISYVEDLRHLRLSTSQVQRMGLAVDLRLSSRDTPNESGTELSEATVVSGDAGDGSVQRRGF